VGLAKAQLVLISILFLQAMYIKLRYVMPKKMAIPCLPCWVRRLYLLSYPMKTKTIYSVYQDWKEPSVTEVKALMEIAAKKLRCDPRDLHKHFSADARTFRRWKEHAGSDPNKSSTIRYTAWAALVAITTGDIIFTPTSQPIEPQNRELFAWIQSNYVFTADNFISPSEKAVLAFIGRNNSISGMTRTDLAGFLGYNQAHFGRLISKMNFNVWACLLMIYGVPVDSLFRPQS
jgi:hypothetical protein